MVTRGAMTVAAIMNAVIIFNLSLIENSIIRKILTRFEYPRASEIA